MDKETIKLQPNKHQKTDRIRLSPWAISLTLMLGICSFLFFSGWWYLRVYGDTGFDSVLYTLTAGLDGAQSDFVTQFLLEALVPTLICTALGCAGLFLLTKNKVQRLLVRIGIALLSLLMVFQAASSTGFTDYAVAQTQDSLIFENYYVTPDEGTVIFPEEKRNLIYIFLESMETTFLSEEHGGALAENLIPELYELAKENVSFSHNEDVGGFLPMPGTTWTVGAMVGQTSGVPLFLEGNAGDSESKDILPGILTLTDVLAREGYYQALMVGSDASFGDRDRYYLGHGADAIYDIYTAREDGVVPEDYYVWWGMEDQHLFEYAKQELLEIYAQGKPFAFTMLTVDTHNPDGYVCAACTAEHEEQYANVISCSSRQVAEFISWIREQDFYDNTAIILAGDHLSMNQSYFTQKVEEEYVRRNYNCFINAAKVPSNLQNRCFCALDLFPTTLAAMGCTIKGDRLGLGTDLFSDQPTLSETLGYEQFFDQLAMNSKYYTDTFL